ncbi:hypothetical protein LTR85_004143 [Meristemomyces frigidus]|nr:hypothetical protein LTR85_004143 [Meristemomyces frigidus]
MASKEATVYIVDCGSTMGEKSHGRPQSNLDWALEYVWDKITTTVANGRKTALAGVVGLRTDGTENLLDSEEDYAHITVFQELGQVLMPQLRKLRQELVVSQTEDGDAMSALIIAIQMIVSTCKKLQYQRRIVLVTDGRGTMQADDLADITSKLKEDNIDLVVLGVDFDDAEYGFKEEGTDETKAENEAILKQLCDDCGGAYGTLVQAVDELGVPRVKTTKPVPSYRGMLTLGNPEEYDTALAIDVERYPKTMKAAPPSASQFVIRSDMAAGEATQSTQTMDGEEAPNGTNDGLAAVKTARTYQVDDEKAPGGKLDVERDELSKGYEYGRTAVHISESDQIVTLYETSPSFDILGFVDKNQYERYLDMSRSNVVVAQRTNDKASMALSSLIHALYELESYAVARLVMKENKEPRIVLLAPNIEPEFECLYDVELPFAEGVRSYKFPPLDRVVTVSGKVLKVHRNLPNDDLQAAMSDYVDSMDLSTFGQDEEGQPAEYGSMDETYSPMLHRINQVVKHRAVYPDTDPPPPYEILTRYSQPPSELLKAAQPALSRVIKCADVKKVPPKARGRRYGRKEAPKPLSELDVSALLAQDPKRSNKQARIDPKNAIPEFKQLLQTSEELPQLQSACGQLKTIIFDWIKHSVGDSGYGRAVEAIRVMREEMAEMDIAAPYNDVLRELQAKLLGGELGGERKEMWYRVRVNRLGLLLAKECEGGVSEEEGKAFLSAAPAAATSK